MNKNIRVSLLVGIFVLGAAALAWGGFSVGRSSTWGMDGFYPDGLTGYSNQESLNSRIDGLGSIDRFGMMGGNGIMGIAGAMDSSGLMGSASMMTSDSLTNRYGMMGGNGIMGGFANLGNTDSLSVEETQTAVEAYLESYNEN